MLWYFAILWFFIGSLVMHLRPNYSEHVYRVMFVRILTWPIGLWLILRGKS